ncbi:MAG: TRAM domain-containing protein, partial [Microcystis sp.]
FVKVKITEVRPFSLTGVIF